MDRSLGFGSTACDCSPCSDSVSLRLRNSCPLTSPHAVTRRLILQLCAIGSRRVFSLGGWSPLLPAGFLVSRRTQDRVPCGPCGFVYGAFTLSDGPSQTLPLPQSFLTARGSPGRVLQPRRCVHRRFGLLPVRSPLLGESRFDFFSCRYLDGSLPCVYRTSTI